MEREKFEESLKCAFEKAEITPSEKVWTNIELDLEKEKGGHLKRRLLFYQMLAAASVVFAMAIGGAAVYFNMNTRQPSDTNLALETPASPETLRPADAVKELSSPTENGSRSITDGTVRSERANDAAIANNSIKPEETNDNPIRSRSVSPARNGGDVHRPDLAVSGPAAMSVPDEETFPEARQIVFNRDLPALYTPREIRLNLPSEKESVDPVVAMLARLEKREREVQGRKDKKEADDLDENLWTSIGFAAGSFNSAQSSPSAAPSQAFSATALAAPIVAQETKASGYSYSMGVNVGTKLSDRWVLQGGVNYLTHASEFTANNVVLSSTNYQQQRFRPASTNELINVNEQDLSNKIVYSAPYNVNNSMRYLSIPLQAGYLLVNRTFGLQLNAGVATDLFLQNTISADSDQLEKTTQGGGEDSPYRSVNLSGLMGTEVSYRFGDHYRVSLNPGVRYPFNTIYKSELKVQSAPVTFDIGLRFRYIFH